MRRGGWIATSALIGAALLVLAAALLRVAACPTCTGLPHEPIGCPDCSDRGRVTLLGRWRARPLDPRLRTLLTTPVDLQTWISGAAVRHPALEGLLVQAGLPADGCKGPARRAGAARFVRPDDEALVLALGEEGGTSQAWLFDRAGTLLDSLAVTGRPPSAVASFFLVTDPDPFAVGKDVVLGLRVLDRSGERPTDISRRLRPAATLEGVRTWRRDLGDVPPAVWIKDGKACFRIQGGKFLLQP